MCVCDEGSWCSVDGVVGVSHLEAASEFSSLRLSFDGTEGVNISRFETSRVVLLSRTGRKKR